MPWWLYPLIAWALVGVQLYVLRRTVQNWKQSERELEESRRYHQRGLLIYQDVVQAMHSVDPDWEDPDEPTIQ